MLSASPQTLLRARSGAPASTNATRQLWSGTYHSIGNRLLREYAHVVGLEPSFSVLDRGDAADLLDFLRQELGLREEGEALSAQGHVSRDLLASREQPTVRSSERSKIRFPGAASGRTS